MVKQSANYKKTNNADSLQEMPLWASKLIGRFDSYSSIMQRSLSESFDRILTQINDLQCVQNSTIARLSAIESRFLSDVSSPSAQQNLIYSTLVKVRADGQRIDEKLRRITWIGIDEQEDEDSTRRFDYEILKEAVYSSGDERLIQEFDNGHITSHRHPVGKPRGPGARGRIIKVVLLNQELRDALLDHMRVGRQSLTQRFVHSFARRDYTAEEVQVDRALRKQVGDLNAREGRLVYVVRDFDIVQPRNPRELLRQSFSNVSPTFVSTRTSTRVTRSRSQLPLSSAPAPSSQNTTVNGSQPTLSPLLPIA
ncbi:hypothetical protein ANCDUO_20304 [Ancylostoma duodenale]|uniref:Uncharacterized protein n=1 Tax=Ancylostoma duodenale TaxID=51022 RepID=A0A0C2FXK1_9BILA|nr:hypothetical protein ANCDUO_20304 [Ancylostoma duodenale]